MKVDNYSIASSNIYPHSVQLPTTNKHVKSGKIFIQNEYKHKKNAHKQFLNDNIFAVLLTF